MLFCQALDLCLDRIHIVRVEAANRKLRAIAPVIQEHGIDYERSHFDKKLRAGTITMDRTTAWISRTLEGIIQSKDERMAVFASDDSDDDKKTERDKLQVN
jgi:hypothetical protein